MTGKMEKKSKSLEETEKIAEDFLKLIFPKLKNEKALVIGLIGDLGSGKTTFTKAIGKILGVKETIQSPTFILHKIYQTENDLFKKIHHFDFYRIENPEELKIFQLEDLFKNPLNLIVIEWPEKGNLINDMIKINFEFVDDQTRKISYEI